FDLASQALTAGKHVLVEKPMTDSTASALELVRLADEQGKVLMVDHTFVYSPAVQMLKQIVDSGELGDILYYDSVRINLGLFQHDINVIWDLAPHDISIMNFAIGKQPRKVWAHGSSHVGNHLENVAYVTLEFPDDFLAHFHVNWLAPVKIRQTLIGGSRKMVVYNDMEPTEKIKIYDRGIDLLPQEGIYHTLVQYRTGDISIPHLDNREPLKLELEHFVQCITDGERPWTDSTAGMQVVKVLEGAQSSIRQNGAMVEFD
ncbi:MAG: Gfo/Idh/MocA family oxidoreductase, partial [Candidatus Neomarinimicrobiota bacterium]